MTEEHEFETNEGKVFKFPTEKERDDFAVEYALGSLVAQGFGSFTKDKDGNPGFRINERGQAWLAEQEAAAVSCQT